MKQRQAKLLIPFNLVFGQTLTSLVVYFAMYHSEQAFSNIATLFPAPTAGKDQILAYLIFACLVNFAVSIPQISVWQRLSAASASKGSFRLATIAVLCAGAVFCFYIALAGAYLAIGYPIQAPADLYIPIVQSGGFAAKFLFPLIFVGFLAALISSADSASMTGTMAIFGRETRQLNQEDWHPLRRRALIGLGTALGALFLFHMYIETIGSGFANVFLTIVFYLFSQLAIAAPIVAVAAIAPKHFRKSRTVIAGLLVSWVLLTVGFVFPSQLKTFFPILQPYFTDQYAGGMWTTIVTMALVSLTTIRFSKKA